MERNSDPVARKTLQDFASQHPHALIATMAISMVVVFLVLATIGGVLGGDADEQVASRDSRRRPGKETRAHRKN